MPGEGQGEIPEPTYKDPEEANRELERMLDELDEMMRSGFAARNRRAAAEIGASVSGLHVAEFHNEDLNLAQRGTNQDGGIAIADADEQKEIIDQLDTQLATATKQAAAAPDAAKTYNLQRYLLFNGLVATATAAAALIYTAIHAAQANKPLPRELPAEVDAKVRELVRAWNKEADAAYWTDLAGYVSLPNQTPPLTLADQILFMSYTIDLAPTSQTWIWDSATDITTLVAQLVDAYNPDQSTPTMYRAAAGLTYKGAAIPRGVTATLLRAALAQILVLIDPPAAASGSAPLPGDGEEPLSPAPDESDQEGEAERDVEEAERVADSFAEKNAEFAKRIADDVAPLFTETLNCDNVALAQTEAVAVPNSAVSDQTPDARATELGDTLTRTLDNVAAKADAPSRQFNVTRFLAGVFGMAVVVAAAVVLLEYLTRSSQGQPTDDLPPVPEETQQQIQDLVTQWKAQTDAQYWESLAVYVEKHPGALTGADQILFLNYTIQLSPPAIPFIWDTQADKVSVVEGLIKTSPNGAALPAMYRALPGLTYQGSPIPRAVAADCARLAIAWVTRGTLPPQQQAATPRPLGDPGAGTGTGITGIPLQLRPRIYVGEVASGLNIDAYVRSIQLLFRPAGLNDPAALSAVSGYRQPAASPYQLLNPAAGIAKLPSAAQQSVNTMIANLTAAIEAAYPLPAGETLVSSQLTCLAAPVYDLPAGTVVYVRTTNQATVQFVLPQVTVDPATGVPSLRQDGPPPGTVLPAPSAPTAVPAAAPSPAVQAVGDDAASIALTVAGNLAWIMPPPWGPVAAAGLTLIQLLLNGPGSAPDELNQVVMQLERIFAEQAVTNDANLIQSLADWLQGRANTLATTQVDNSLYITGTLLPELNMQAAPGKSAYSAIYDLETHLDVPGALGILVLGVTIYLLTLKMTVQLDASLASTAKAAGDVETFTSYTDLWLADYSDFYSAINGYTQNGVTTPGWATRIINHVTDMENARLSQITEPYRYNNQQWIVVQGGGSTGTSGYWVDMWGWTFKDTAAGDTDVTHFVADYNVQANCCNNGGSHTEYQAQVQAARDLYALNISEQLDTQYQDTVATVKAWIAMIQEWNQHLPPRAPTTSVAIDGWNGAAPQGNWVNGSSVAYAVAFANASGPSQKGPWSAFVPTGANAFPTLTGLPVDPLGQTTNRWIYRQFIKPDGTKSPIQIVGITMDATSTTFKDMKM
jgi:hypothetical protein